MTTTTEAPNTTPTTPDEAMEELARIVNDYETMLFQWTDNTSREQAAAMTEDAQTALALLYKFLNKIDKFLNKIDYAKLVGDEEETRL